MQSANRLFLGLLLLCNAASVRADLLPSPTTLAFDDQIIGITSGSKAITFNNNGDEALTVQSLTAAADAFANAGGSCPPFPFTIPAQSSCTFLYTFTPPQSGEYDQTLTIGGAGGGTLSLEGKGISGHVSFEQSQLDFIAVVGTTSAVQTMVVINTGDAPMDVTTVDPVSSPFAYTGGTCPPLPRRLDPELSCTLEYNFTPTITGSTSQVVQVSTPQDRNTFVLYGEGDPPGDAIFADGFD